MDIAEIRKKAKNRKAADDPDVAVKEAPAAGEEISTAPVAEETPGERAEDPLLPAPSRRNAMADANGNDALDRLFAAVDAFSSVQDDFGLASAGEQQELQDEDVRQYLTFRLESEEYALDIAQISEIIKVREMTEVPRCPEYVLGVISLRGVIVPVYDLCRRLKLGVSELALASRIVVCKFDDMTVGFLVDSINQVVRLADAELEPPPGVLSGLDRDMVAGIGRFDGRMIILLNLKSVLEIIPD